MSTRGLLFQRASTIQIQLSVLVLNKVDLIIISLTINVLEASKLKGINRIDKSAKVTYA